MAKRGKSVRKPPTARKVPTRGKRALGDVDVKKDDTRLKRELAEARELRAIINNAPVFLWSDLPDGYCDFLNQRWLNYFNLSLQEAQDAGWATVLHPDDAAHHLESWQKSVSTGIPFESEARFRRPDGDYRWFLTRADPLRDKTGRIVKWYGTNIDIENLKRTERRLTQSEANLAEAQRLSHTGSWALSPATTKILYWSEECYRIWGFDPVQGLPNRETVWRRIHPSDRDRMYAETQEALRQKRDYKVDFRIVLPDATVKYLEAIGHHQFSEHGELVQVVGTNVDVTERKRAELERRRLALLVEQAADLMAIADLSGGTPIYLNKAGLKMVGFDSWEEARAWRGIHYMFPEDRQFVNEVLWPTVLEKGSWSGEMRFRHFKTGDPIPVLYSAFRIDDPETGQPVNVGNVCTDITERKRAEAEARENDRRYREMQMELAHANRVATMGQLTASIAHEVNQPLAAVVANAEACLRWLDRGTPDLDAACRSVKWVIDSANRASEVIRRVRALANKTEIEKVPLDVNDVVREIIALVQRELISHQMSLRTEFEPALPMILGDRVQLQQVIMNLVMNGIEAMQSVTDRPRELVVRSSHGTQEVLVSVTDCGVGVSAENADRLFTAFFTTKSGGMGMGLLDLPFDRGSARRPVVGHGKRIPWCHISVHPAGERRYCVLRLHT